MCEALFDPQELKLENGLYVVGKNVSSPLVANAASILKNRGKPGNLDSFDVGAFRSEDTVTRERAKFMAYALQHNFNHQRRKEYDPYFNLDINALNLSLKIWFKIRTLRLTSKIHVPIK